MSGICGACAYGRADMCATRDCPTGSARRLRMTASILYPTPSGPVLSDRNRADIKTLRVAADGALAAIQGAPLTPALILLTPGANNRGETGYTYEASVDGHVCGSGFVLGDAAECQERAGMALRHYVEMARLAAHRTVTLATRVEITGGAA